MIRFTIRSFPSPRGFIAWLTANRVDIAMLLALTAIAAVPRLVLLGSIPPGLHGDEAIAGLEARSLLDHARLVQGVAAPYSLGAGGVPAGTFYWTAAVFGVLGDSVFTLRLAYALLGIAGVSLSYLAFRVMFNRPIATIATLLLSVSAWHVHYSRIAFIPISWPTVEMATLLLFFLALRHQSRLLFGLAGAALGAGAYTYQAFPVFATGLGLVVLWLAVFEYRTELLKLTGQVATVLGAALFVGLPMASFAYHHGDLYLGRYREYSVTHTAGYQRAGNVFAKADVLAGRELDFVRSLISRPVPDGHGESLAAAAAVDASGIFPLVDRVTLGLLIVGGAIALWRLRDRSYAAVLILIVVIAAGPALAEEGWYRRTLGLVPLLALVAALPLAFVWEEGRKRGLWWSVGAGLIVLGVLGSVAGINLVRYFGSYDDAQLVRLVYAADMADASQFMSKLPDGTYVYFYSERHSINYEMRRFIAPHVQGVDRSLEFGGTASLEADRSRDLAYIFLGNYLDQLPEVERLYPGGTEHILLNKKDGSTIFASYLLPRAPGAAPPAPPAQGQPAAPTPTVSVCGPWPDAAQLSMRTIPCAPSTVIRWPSFSTCVPM